MSDIGDRIRQRRIELGLSQEELGEHIGTRQEAVSKWESQGPKHLANVERMAQALEVTPWWLAWGVYPKTPGAEAV